VLEKAEFVRLKLLDAQKQLPDDHPAHPNNNASPSKLGGGASSSAGGVVLSSGVTAEKLMYDRALEMSRSAAINEIANVVQVFSDVLSYLRLYALSLAGAIMANTFNQEGSALGLFMGFIIILIGHTVNLGLSFMGGVIHGLRLNFLEWYHYCFNGGGRLFKPLQKLKKG
jgi:vacuolar-type H+-ATPase subunit I/STV1